MRKLATIRKVKEILPIEGADAIECAVVDGWKVVTKKGEYQPGASVVYFEIDSWIPQEMAPFLSKGKEPKQYNGVLGNRLSTVRLRGQISQGLLLPMSILEKYQVEINENTNEILTELLNIQKWEPAVPAQLAGEVKGKLTSFVPVTDEERIQNLISEIAVEIAGKTFEKTIKLDGTSMTVFRHDDNYGVTGRNWEYRETEGNTYWKVARKNNLLEAINSLGKNIALRGELIGEGIQENNEKIKGHDFYLFNIWDINEARYLSPKERDEVVAQLNQLGAKIKQVPTEGFITFSDNVTVEEILALADGSSMFAENREGIVFKRIDGFFSFKAISNWYLLKHGNR